MSATPTRDVESRLTAALQARAEQVTHDDLTTLLVPKPQRSRRPAVIAAGVAAAVAAAVVAVPLVAGDGGSEPRPAPAPDPSPSPTVVVEQARDEVLLDIDGDCEQDRAYLEDGELRLVASTGTQVGVPVPDGSVLLPPVTDAGSPHPLVVAVPPVGTGVGASLTFRDDRTDTLVADDLPASAAIGLGKTVWVDEIGGLMVGEYDATVPEDQRVSVSTTALRAKRNGNLVEYGVGDLCWDRTTDPTPVFCDQLPAQDADPSLMFPVVEQRYPVGTSHGSFSGQYDNIVLRDTGSGYELVYTWDSMVSRAPVEGVDVPELLGSAISSSQDAPAVVVAQESGDSTRMTVFGPTSEGFRALDVEGDRFLGNGFGAAPDYLLQRTWMSQQSGLWSARQVSTDEPNRYEVTRWRVDDTRLVADVQGEACLDLDRGRKLDDATCGTP